MCRLIYQKKRGSYTIELSLLTPVIIALFLFILFSAYYTHDRVLIEKTCYISALRASLCVDLDKREQTALEYFDSEITKRLLGSWNVNRECVCSDETVTVSVDADMDMKEGLLKNVLKEKIFNFSTECSADIANESRYLREIKRKK